MSGSPGTVSSFESVLGIESVVGWFREETLFSSKGKICGLEWRKRLHCPGPEAYASAILGVTRSGSKIGSRGIDVQVLETRHGQLDGDVHDLDERVGRAICQHVLPPDEDFVRLTPSEQKTYTDRLMAALNRRTTEGRRLWRRFREQIIAASSARVQTALSDALPWLRFVPLRSPSGVRILVLWDEHVPVARAAAIMRWIRDEIGEVDGVVLRDTFPAPGGRTGRLPLTRSRLVDAHGRLMHRRRADDLQWLLTHAEAMRNAVDEFEGAGKAEHVAAIDRPEGEDKLAAEDFSAVVADYLENGIPCGESWLAAHRIAFATLVGLDLSAEQAHEVLDHVIDRTGCDGARHAQTERGRRALHAILAHALARYDAGITRRGLLGDRAVRESVARVLGIELSNRAARPFESVEERRERVSRVRAEAARRRWDLARGRAKPRPKKRETVFERIGRQAGLFAA